MTKEDKRLRLIEVLLTLGGFLGIIIALQPKEFDLIKDTFSMFLVLFIVTSFLTYASILHGGAKKRIQFLTFFLSASFSALLILAIANPLLNSFKAIINIAPDTWLAVIIVSMVFAMVLFFRLYTTMASILLKE